jgi:hypothetical protein
MTSIRWITCSLQPYSRSRTICFARLSALRSTLCSASSTFASDATLKPAAKVEEAEQSDDEHQREKQNHKAAAALEFR